MHIRIRIDPNTAVAMLTKIDSPHDVERSSKTLDRIWQSVQENPPENPLCTAIYILKVNNPVLPRIIIEWPDYGFQFALQIDDGIAQWVWASETRKRSPSKLRIPIYMHHFARGKGHVVPVSNHTLNVIQSFVEACVDPFEYHYLLFRQHGHCYVNVWLKFGFKSDLEAREYMTLTASENTPITDIFKKLCGQKAQSERFCLMPARWINKALVKGMPISYQEANAMGYRVGDFGWGEQAWLWPCAPLIGLISYDGIWEEQDLEGFSLVKKTDCVRPKTEPTNEETFTRKFDETRSDDVVENASAASYKGAWISLGDPENKSDLLESENSIPKMNKKRGCFGSTEKNHAISVESSRTLEETCTESAGCANEFLNKIDEKNMVSGCKEMVNDGSVEQVGKVCGVDGV